MVINRRLSSIKIYYEGIQFFGENAMYIRFQGEERNNANFLKVKRQFTLLCLMLIVGIKLLWYLESSKNLSKHNIKVLF